MSTGKVWGDAGRGRRPLWRTFLAEQRALLRELDELEHAISSVQVPVLLLADPGDTLVPVDTARRIARALPDARLQLVEGAGYHLPRRQCACPGTPNAAPKQSIVVLTCYFASVHQCVLRRG
jgi:pimeloyl-ACP methyl ester carboxylesterase